MELQRTSAWVRLCILLFAGTLPGVGSKVESFIDTGRGSLNGTGMGATGPLHVEQSYENHTVEWRPGSVTHRGLTTLADLPSGTLKGKSFLTGDEAISFTLGIFEDLFLEAGPDDMPAPGEKAPFEMMVRVDGTFFREPFIGPGMTLNTQHHSSLSLQSVSGASDLAKFNYSYMEVATAMGTTPIHSTSQEGNVGIVRNSIPEVDVILRPRIMVSGEFDPVRGKWVSELVAMEGELFGFQSVRGGHGRAINFYDSARLSYTLPPGFTLRSGSGVFLTQAQNGSEIPEPWMTPMVAVAGIGLVLVYRRRRGAGKAG